MSSAICFNLDQSKIVSSANGITHHEVSIKDRTVRLVNLLLNDKF